MSGWRWVQDYRCDVCGDQMVHVEWSEDDDDDQADGLLPLWVFCPCGGRFVRAGRERREHVT